MWSDSKVSTFSWKRFLREGHSAKVCGNILEIMRTIVSALVIGVKNITSRTFYCNVGKPRFFFQTFQTRSIQSKLFLMATSCVHRFLQGVQQPQFRIHQHNLLLGWLCEYIITKLEIVSENSGLAFNEVRTHFCAVNLMWPIRNRPLLLLVTIS